MSYRRILWVETMPDRGPKRIVAGTARVLECRDEVFLLANEWHGRDSLVFTTAGPRDVIERRSVVPRQTKRDACYVIDAWQRIADSYNETKLPSVRFWVWESDGWVRLTLEPGQRIEHVTAGPDEEGWSRNCVSYEYETDHPCGGPAVVRRCFNEGQDCDGRHEWHNDSHCPVSMLSAATGDDGENEVRVPDWQPGECGQRDYFAEAAGY